MEEKAGLLRQTAPQHCLPSKGKAPGSTALKPTQMFLQL